MNDVPQPVLFTVIAALCGTIAYLFRLVVAHHSRSMDEARAERASLIKANFEHAAAYDRNTKATAQLALTMYFLPPEFKKSAEATLREIAEAERKREP